MDLLKGMGPEAPNALCKEMDVVLLLLDLSTERYTQLSHFGSQRAWIDTKQLSGTTVPLDSSVRSGQSIADVVGNDPINRKDTFRIDLRRCGQCIGRLSPSQMHKIQRLSPAED